jgi:hypothetical protein
MGEKELAEAQQDLEKYGVRILRKEPVPKQEDYRVSSNLRMTYLTLSKKHISSQ